VNEALEAQARAYAKSRWSRNLMRAAGRQQLSARAQAILAHLVIESWPTRDRRDWETRISQRELANRLDCSMSSVKRAIGELVLSSLLVLAPGRVRVVSRYRLCWWLADAPPQRVLYKSPVLSPVEGVTGDPSEGSPVDGPRATRGRSTSTVHADFVARANAFLAGLRGAADPPTAPTSPTPNHCPT